MKELIRMFEKFRISVAFAEAGDQKTAQQLMGPQIDEVETVESCQTA